MATTTANVTTTATYTVEYLEESRTALLNAFYSVPIPLEIVSTAFRLWVKIRAKGGRLAFDDYLIVWATISAIAVCIAGLVYGAPNGLGRHIQAVPDENLSIFLKGDYIFSHFYDVAIASTKLSVLALYWRIFATARFRTAVAVTAAAVFCWLIAIEVALGLGCQPIQGWWDAAAAAAAGSCVDKVAFTYATNSINLATDLWVFIMPIPVILSLQASMDRRIGLCFLFSVGLGTCAISAARLSVIVSVGSDDITWSEVPLGILSAWEPCGAILCANLPVVYRVAARGFKQVRSKARSGARWTWTWSWSRGLIGLDSNIYANNNDKRKSDGDGGGGGGVNGRPGTHTSQEPLYHRWAPTDGESVGGDRGISDEGHGLFSASKFSVEGHHPEPDPGPDGMGSELGSFGDSKIMVERSFRQDFERR